MRIGLVSIIQETNTFSATPASLDDFTIALGEDVLGVVSGTNSELAGALRVLAENEARPIPVMYAWAMPSGRLANDSFEDLRRLLAARLKDAGRLDGLVLSLHGSMAATNHHDADGELISIAREIVGSETPIGVCLDLHANVTRRMVDLSDAISAYHTDPHIDMAEAGARAAERVVSMVASGASPATGFAKRPMIVPAETMSTESGILAEIRAEVTEAMLDGVQELCLFPVQPWLDVPELGFGVVVTTDGDQGPADELAQEIASIVWRRRREFVIDRLMDPDAALQEARASKVRPFIISESADSPTAGAAGDSPVMVAAALASGDGLLVYIPVVDPGAVAACHAAGIGSDVELKVGGSIDSRWWESVGLRGEVLGLGEGSYRLEGKSFTGIEVSMGRFATVGTDGLRLLLTERPAWTSDPATYRFAGLSPDSADVIVVRSCSDFRPNFPDAAEEAVTLDVPGASTPRLDLLRFQNSSRPPYPIDAWEDLDERATNKE